MATPNTRLLESPIHPATEVLEAAKIPQGVGLCLSGGGYRAMLFHIGALWRLNEAGALPRLARISSVSGGSITAGVLGLNWKKLAFDAATCVAAQFRQFLVDPVRSLANHTVDEHSIFEGVLLPGSVGDRVASDYDSHLFKGATLRDLPSDAEGPRFVINATNVMTGSLWRFSRPFMGDWRIGLIDNPDLPLCTAVAASSAFPPVLSPVTLKLDPAKIRKTEGADLCTAPYTSLATLSDGGVYDNLGLETIFKSCATLLVSDAGQKMTPDPEPAHDWARHAIRVLDLEDNQVRNLRKRQLISSFERTGEDSRTGAYWSMRSLFTDYTRDQPLSDPLAIARIDPTPLASIKTRLKKLDSATQERLINWGYAIADTALRRHAPSALSQAKITLRDPLGLPYPQSRL